MLKNILQMTNCPACKELNKELTILQFVHVYGNRVSQLANAITYDTSVSSCFLLDRHTSVGGKMKFSFSVI